MNRIPSGRWAGTIAISLVLAALFFSGCTDVKQWDVIAHEESSRMESIEPNTGLVTAGPDLAYPEQKPISDTLYTDIHFFSDFASSKTVMAGQPIQIGDLGCEVVVEDFEIFEDKNGSGRYGIAIQYAVTNRSDRIVLFNGLQENVTRFAMFSPEGTSLKAHYNLWGAPIEDYPERITYANPRLLTASMNEMHLEPNKTLNLFRVYDYAGPGTYHLYLSTEASTPTPYESAVGLRITVG